ncbi:RDD family protein [Streptomyces sp. NPDC055140]
MSAPTPAPGDDRPRDGYYPDPSIPGYVRYWNGVAWVPGTSRPAPSDGEPLGAPAGVTPAPAPTPAPASVEETGPIFLDEEPERYSDEPAAPEPATAWQADASRQTGFGGEQDRRVSWGTDPRVPAPQQQEERADGAVANRPAPSAPVTPPTDGTVTFRRPTPPTDRPEGTMTMRALSARQVPGQQGPAVQGQQGPAVQGQQGPAVQGQQGPAVQGQQGQVQGQQVQGQLGQQAQAQQAQPHQPIAQHPQAAQQSAPQQAEAQPRSGSQPQPQPQAGFAPQGPAQQPQAQQVQAHQAHAAQAAPLHPQAPHAPQAPTPAQQPQAGRPGAVPPQAAGAASGTPMTSGPGGGSPSWAQQVHQLAQPQSAQLAQPAAGEPAEPEGPVTPWKPVANDPFLAAAQAQASARPAGLGKRLAARLIDSVMLGAVTAVAAVPLGTKAIDHIDGKIDAAKASGREATVWLLDGTTGAYLGIVLAVLLVAGVLYEALPTAKWGRTLGKKVCGLQVRDIEEHEAPTFGAALRRWLVYSVTGLLAIGVLGVLWCLFDRPWRQCWHDKAARTFVAG